MRKKWSKIVDDFLISNKVYTYIDMGINATIVTNAIKNNIRVRGLDKKIGAMTKRVNGKKVTVLYRV